MLRRRIHIHETVIDVLTGAYVVVPDELVPPKAAKEPGHFFVTKDEWREEEQLCEDTFTAYHITWSAKP